MSNEERPNKQDKVVEANIPQADAPQVDLPSGIGEPPSQQTGPKSSGSHGMLKMWGIALAVIALVVIGNIVMGQINQPPADSGASSGSGGTQTSNGASTKPDTLNEFTSKPDTLENELFAVGMRYRPSGSDEHKEQWNVVETNAFSEQPGEDWTFTAGVIEAAQTITDSEEKGESSLANARQLATSAAGEDAKRKEFADLLDALESGRYEKSYPSSWDGGSSGGVTSNGFSPQDMLKDAGGEGSFKVDDNPSFDFGSLFSAPQSEESSSDSSSTSSKYMSLDSPEMTDIAESETYAPIDEPGFLSTSTSPVSTVSADVDTASYTNFRRMVRDGYTQDEIYDDSVRVEEWINYFDYGYASPDEGELFGVTSHLGTCPWNKDTQLVTLGFSTNQDAAKPEGGNNIVFLVDVSGSMDDRDKLYLLQEAMSRLTDRLGNEDTISLVTYANGSDVVLDGKSGEDKVAIKEAIRSLYASGGTNGGEGLKGAYETAKKHFRENGVNRIILCSDGDMNLGMSTTGELQDYVDARRGEGIYLSVLGFGTGNYHDQNMEAIADHGNGSYYYIDCLDEAERVLGEELSSTMNPLADDVKIQVEFNPANVKAYRLIGYVNRTLAAEDFRNDAKDGGEVGAGQAFTVAYEIVPTDSAKDDINEVELRYGNKDSDSEPQHSELESVVCMIGGKEYDKFDAEVLSYEIEFGADETIPAMPELKELPEGWKVLSSKSVQGEDGTVTSNISIGNDKAARQYVFKYVRK